MKQTDAPLNRKGEGLADRKAGYSPVAEGRANNVAPNSCVNCKYEETCGYSPLAMLDRRTDESATACCLGLMSPRGNRAPEPFFRPKGFEFTPDEEVRLETEHRATHPPHEWNYIVRLSFGDFDRVNQHEYDRALAAGFDSKFLKLASGAWRMLEDLTVVDGVFQ